MDLSVCTHVWGCVHTCVIWVRGAPDGRNGRAVSVSVCERRESGVLGSVTSFGCSGPVTEKCTHWTPLTPRNHKTLSCGYSYSPCLPLTHSLTHCINFKDSGCARERMFAVERENKSLLMFVGGMLCQSKIINDSETCVTSLHDGKIILIWKNDWSVLYLSALVKCPESSLIQNTAKTSHNYNIIIKL